MRTKSNIISPLNGSDVSINGAFSFAAGIDPSTLWKAGNYPQEGGDIQAFKSVDEETSDINGISFYSVLDDGVLIRGVHTLDPEDDHTFNELVNATLDVMHDEKFQTTIFAVQTRKKDMGRAENLGFITAENPVVEGCNTHVFMSYSLAPITIDLVPAFQQHFDIMTDMRWNLVHNNDFDVTDLDLRNNLYSLEHLRLESSRDIAYPHVAMMDLARFFGQGLQNDLGDYDARFTHVDGEPRKIFIPLSWARRCDLTRRDEAVENIQPYIPS